MKAPSCCADPVFQTPFCAVSWSFQLSTGPIALITRESVKTLFNPTVHDGTPALLRKKRDRLQAYFFEITCETPH